MVVSNTLGTHCFTWRDKQSGFKYFNLSIIKYIIAIGDHEPILTRILQMGVFFCILNAFNQKNPMILGERLGSPGMMHFPK